MAKVYGHVVELLQRVCGRGADVLEVGCGPKQYALAHRGRYIGIDLRRPPVDSGGPGPDLLGDAQVLPIRDCHFDVVFTVATLLIVPDPSAALREAHRVLRPGGTVVVFDYNWWVARRLQRADPDHRHRFTSRSLARMLSGAGFEAHIHREAVPIRGLRVVSALMRTPACRRFVYGFSNWVVVTGRKAG